MCRTSSGVLIVLSAWRTRIRMFWSLLAFMVVSFAAGFYQPIAASVRNWSERHKDRRVRCAAFPKVRSFAHRFETRCLAQTGIQPPTICLRSLPTYNTQKVSDSKSDPCALLDARAYPTSRASAASLIGSRPFKHNVLTGSAALVRQRQLELQSPTMN
jgi:hypothetical protein